MRYVYILEKETCYDFTTENEITVFKTYDLAKEKLEEEVRTNEKYMKLIRKRKDFYMFTEDESNYDYVCLHIMKERVHERSDD